MNKNLYIAMISKFKYINLSQVLQKMDFSAESGMQRAHAIW